MHSHIANVMIANFHHENVCDLDFLLRRAILLGRDAKDKIMFENNDFYVRLGALLKESREGRLRVTQEEFAERAGLSRPSIANIEKGRQQISVLQLVKFSAILGVEPSALIPHSDTTTTESLLDELPASANQFKSWISQLQGD